MERERITSLVWRWDDSLGGAGFRVTVADYVVGMITMNLAGECWEAVPYPPGAAADENALPPRGFREINSAESYIEAHAEDADFTVLHHIAEVLKGPPMFSLIINTDNAAFEGAEAAETARILREVAARLERGQLDGIARDLNGNKAGEFRLNAATALAEHLDGPADDTVLAMTPRPESDSPENIGAGCSNAYLSELVDSASEDASEGRPLNALQVAALDEAASRIRERIGDDEPGDYHGPAA